MKTRKVELMSDILNIEFPVIMAPMFLVSNTDMLIEGMKNGIAGVIPSLNFRTGKELEDAIDILNNFYQSKENKGIYGINLIVQRTNSKLKEHLEICVRKKVPFYITSLGSPKEVIDKVKAYGAKVYSDVTNLKHAQRVYEMGADGFIAVSNSAGGHSGTFPNQLLIPALKKQFPDVPVIAAGGIASGDGILSMLALGAAGVSIGTLFIASKESNVSDEYKEAILQSGMEDIVMTNRLSGAPVSIIHTPYYKKLKENDSISEQNTETKMEKMEKGIKMLEKSIQPGNYNNLWVAGKSVELIKEIKPVADIIQTLKKEFLEAKKRI
jgi:nitronate monooxygenase